MNTETEIHAHEIMKMMANSDRTYTRESLFKTIAEKFGKNARFCTCCKNELTAQSVVEIMIAKGKIAGAEDALFLAGNPTCGHQH